MSGTNYNAKYNDLVKISLTNDFDDATQAECVGDPNVVATDAGVFTNGCIMRRTDTGTGTTLYENTGTIVLPSWTLLSTGGGATPGLPLTSIQFNDAGSFGGNSRLTWDNVVFDLSVDSTVAGIGGTASITQTDAGLGYVSGANTFGVRGSAAGGGELHLISDTVQWIWPHADGAAGFQLTTNGAGVMTWAASGAGNAWALLGNGGTNPAINFVGTTDGQPLNFRINNQRAGYLTVASSTAFGYQAGISDASGNGAFFGSNAGSSNTGGLQNTFIGTGSGGQNTTGDRNTFTGYNSGVLTSTSDDNTFMGSDAGAGNTTGSSNTYIGSGSAQSATTGSDNTFLGYHSGFVNTASDNTFLGTSAGLANTTGIGNTFVGSDAGGNNISTHENVYVGYQAGYRQVGNNNVAIGAMAYDGSVVIGNNTGTNNVAIGRLVLSANSSGSANIAIGNGTLAFNTTGQNNVAVGVNALSANLVADNSTAVGTGALNISSGTQNTAVGSAAGGGVTGGVRNTLMGYAAGNALGVGNDNTYIGFAAGIVSINASGNTGVGSNALALTTAAAAANNTAVGANALYNTNAQNNTGFGTGAGQGNVGGQQNTFVGSLTNTLAANQNDQTAVGYNAIVDNRGTAIGSSTNAADSGIALGYTASAAANEFALSNAITNWKFQGDSYTLPTAFGAAGTALVDTTGTGVLVWTAVGTGNVTGTGVATRIAFWSAGSVISSDAELEFLSGQGVHSEDNSATHNIFFGADAGAAAISGLSNVAVGYRVGQALTSGDSNVMIGSGAGNLISTADGNVAIGTSAASTLTTGSNNVVIGNNAAVGAVGTTGAIALGNAASAVTNQFALPDAITTWKFQGDSYTLPTAFPASNGDVLSSTTAGVMSWVSNGSVTSWSVVGVNTAIAVNSGYITNAGGNINLTLPVTAAVGSVFEATADTAGGWTIVQNAGQRIRFGTSDTTIGVGGSLVSSAIGDTIRMVCTVADTDFRVLSSIGTLTVN